MIIFGGSNCIPFLIEDDQLIKPKFWKYNFMNRTMIGTIINGMFPPKQILDLYKNDMMYSVEFDKLYANYILTCDSAFVSFMNILMGQYYGENSFVLINDELESIINLTESIIKLIQVRYGLNCSIVNDPYDILYCEESDMSDNGIKTFMIDKERFTKLTNDESILQNAYILEEHNGTYI